MKRDDLLTVDISTLAPMEDYQAPKFPTYKDEKPNLAKKVPARWKGKGIIATATGLLSAAALTGCGMTQPTASTTTEPAMTELPIPIAPPLVMEPHYCSNLHHGGSGGAPLYVAYLTEQEALGIIRNQLEAAGLSLTEVSPRSVTIDDVYTELGNFGHAHTTFRAIENDIQMHLINEENEMGIVVVPDWSWWLESECTVEVRDRITQRFLHEHGISVHILFDTGAAVSWWDGDWEWEDIWDDETGTYVLDDEIQTHARERAGEKLAEQVQNFISQLRDEDVID